MAKKINNVRAGTRLVKCLLLLSLCLIHFPSKYKGNCMNLKNYTEHKNSKLDNTRKESSTEMPHMKIPPSATNETQKWDWTTGCFVIFAILSLMTSTALLVLVLSYLNNVSMDKQCLLLYLFKDVVMIWILMNCVNAIRNFLFYFTGDELGIDEFPAKIISYCFSSLCLLLLVAINIIRALKLYMMKTKMLDPPMPWGDDDGSGIKLIRFVSIVVIIGLNTTLYGLGLDHKTFYNSLRGHLQSSNALPEDDLVHPLLYLLLVLSFALISLTTKFYEYTNNQNTEYNIPFQMNYFLWIVLVVIGFSSCVSVFEIFEVTTRMKLFQIMNLMTLVITPAVVILSTSQLKSCAFRVIKNIPDEMFLLNIYMMPTFLTLLIYGTLYLVYQLLSI